MMWTTGTGLESNVCDGTWPQAPELQRERAGGRWASKLSLKSKGLFHAEHRDVSLCTHLLRSVLDVGAQQWGFQATNGAVLATEVLLPEVLFRCGSCTEPPLCKLLMGSWLQQW
jgi:hypothetical protein